MSKFVSVNHSLVSEIFNEEIGIKDIYEYLVMCIDLKFLFEKKEEMDKWLEDRNVELYKNYAVIGFPTNELRVEFLLTWNS